MSRTLTIPDDLYERLEAEARARGLDGVESLLDKVVRSDNSLSQRREAVRKIDALREQLSRSTVRWQIASNNYAKTEHVNKSCTTVSHQS